MAARCLIVVVLGLTPLGLACGARGTDKCAPAPEECNGLDDDCDGEIDNGSDLCSLSGPHVEGGVCLSGACELRCEQGWGDCDGEASSGCEVDLRSSLENCGFCGEYCSWPRGSGRCEDGGCRLLSCDEGFHDCDGDEYNGCESDLTDLANCGGCGALCELHHAREACRDSQCTIGACEEGYDNCDQRVENGCEVSLNTDIFNCGRCEQSCGFGGPHAAPICDGGECRLSCDPAWADCNGDEGDGCESLLSEPAHCSDCDTSCPPEAYLCSGTAAEGFECIPPPCGLPLQRCGDSCVDVTTDPEHCGHCHYSCSQQPFAAPRCEEGECAIACDQGMGDCDGDLDNGCETPLADTENCGACGVECLPYGHRDVAICDHGVCLGGHCRGGTCGDGQCCEADGLESEELCPEDCGGVGPSDGGVVDGGGADAGEMDGGASDAGVVDSGGADTAPADAAGSDAGPIDADADGGGGADSAPADAAPDTGEDALGEPPVCGCENSGGVVVGPACWFLSESNQSCAVLCSSLALVYDEATRTYAGSSGSFARDRTQSQNCGSVLDALGVPEGSVQRVSGTNEQGVGCHYDEESSSFSDGRYFDYSQPTSAEAAYFGGEYDSYRACACACP